MDMNRDDSIVAISSATGGAIAVIRISGPTAFSICRSIWTSGKLSCCDKVPHGKMLLGKCEFAHDFFPENAFAVFFYAPQSYTGEDIAEIHCHGGPLLAQRILEALLKNGARQAEPGEFTYRAFMNGKMDLSQAEAVADIIEAKTELALDIAEKQLDGSIGRRFRTLESGLTAILAECEAQLDFSEENEVGTNKAVIDIDLVKLLVEMEKIFATGRDGMIIRDGVRIVIAGHPNAGKSSLFNLLLGKERAIVSEIPGTTRDTIEEDIILGNLRVTLIDTAGIREADNLIEKLGIQRSRKSIESANMVLWVLDPLTDVVIQIMEMKAHCPKKHSIAVWNKSDLLTKEKIASLDFAGFNGALVSAKTETGIEKLKEIIIEHSGLGNLASTQEFAINTRHSELLKGGIANLKKAQEEMRNSQYETASLFLRKTISSIRQIIGEELQPDVLEIIFSKFCVGK